ncbi:multicopper oxidase domain-containing protein [Streptomyces sp. NPDC056647]|uniref:multicopper oxidase domain-containing protein n=1 Tax=unclassified Streptomyces TaxID=2593676 RepID=UPI0036AA7547
MGRGVPSGNTYAPFTWDYRTYAHPGPSVQRPEHTIDLLVEKRNAAEKGFNIWTLNGVPFSMDTDKPVLDVDRGKRYRLRLRNATDDIHPIHLHRHTFEVTHIASTSTHGLHKDVVMLGGYQSLDFDFTADQPGLSLFHCHQQLHRDYGFVILLRYLPRILFICVISAVWAVVTSSASLVAGPYVPVDFPVLSFCEEV